jgi:Ca2+-binding RTX toxin-like protein
LAFAALAFTPVAHAATVTSLGSGGLVVDADDAGESSLVTVGLYSEQNGLNWIVTLSSGPLDPGAGCSAAGTQQVRCTRVGEGVSVSLGDMPDRVTPRAGSIAFVDTVTVDLGSANDFYTGFPARDVVNAGSGNDALDGAGGADSLTGSTGNDQITGGEGRDAVNGSDGDDTFFDRVPEGTNPDGEGDSYSGGIGFDTVTYLDRPAIIIIAGNEEATGGQIGSSEGDGLRGLERYIGGQGDDRLNSAFSAIPVTYNGAAGADQLLGSSANDALIGGGGAEVSIKGNAGNDTIDAKLGEVVGTTPIAVGDLTIDCGSGLDLAVLDLKDDLSPTGCESVDRAPAGERPDATLPARKLVLRARSRVATVPLRCPRSRASGCKGKVRLRRGKRSFATTAYKLRRGKRARLRVAAPFRGKGSVVTVEKGRIGPKSVTREVRVR